MSETCPRCHARLPAGGIVDCPTCMLADETSPPRYLGGRYEVLGELGRGGMGTVYKARDSRTDELVAVKVLADELVARVDLQERFRREARAMALLRHPNVVRLREFGTDTGRAFIVMEYVAGQPLSEHMPMKPARAVEVLAQICDALAAAHRYGLVHRDLKPANVLVTSAGRVKVTDFGVSAFTHGERDDTRMTAMAHAVGTPGYMAPEAQIGGTPDPRMDVYSLGVLLYEMLTGRQPVGIFELPGPPFDRVLRKALAADPGQRYADAGALRRDLLAESPVGDLPRRERYRAYGAALLLNLGTALTLPVVMSGAATWSWPLLAVSVGLLGTGFVAQGRLQRRWRALGLDREARSRPLTLSPPVLFLSLVSVLAYVLQGTFAKLLAPLSLEATVVEQSFRLGALLGFWMALQEARRIGRPLRREPMLWGAVALLLVPPALGFFGR
jgi:eukaryotic-like serine/threonine-protein kinase